MRALLASLLLLTPAGDPLAAAPINPDVPDVVPLKAPVKASPPRQTSKAASLLKRARRMQAAGRHADAIPVLKSALVMDPVSKARYYLAQAFVLTGNSEHGLGLLAQLKKAGCGLCFLWLVESSRDTKGFAAVHADARYKALLKGVWAPVPDTEKLTGGMLGELKKGRYGNLLATVKYGWHVRVKQQLGERTSRKYLTSRETVDRFKYKWAKLWGPHTGLACEGLCCAVQHPVKCGYPVRAKRVCWLPIDRHLFVPDELEIQVCE